MSNVPVGTTSRSEYLSIRSASTFLGVPALEAEDLAMYYARPKAAAVEIVLSDIDPDDPYTEGGFAEVDAVKMPGIYRVDVPDAAYATGATEVILYPSLSSDYLAPPLKVILYELRILANLGENPLVDTPIRIAIQSGKKLPDAPLYAYTGAEFRPPPFYFENADGTPADLSSREFIFTAWKTGTPPAATEELFEVVGPTNLQKVDNAVIVVGPTVTETQGNHRWALWEIGIEHPVLRGPLIVLTEHAPVFS